MLEPREPRRVFSLMQYDDDRFEVAVILRNEVDGVWVVADKESYDTEAGAEKGYARMIKRWLSQ